MFLPWRRRERAARQPTDADEKVSSTILAQQPSNSKIQHVRPMDASHVSGNWHPAIQGHLHHVIPTARRRSRITFCHLPGGTTESDAMRTGKTPLVSKLLPPVIFRRRRPSTPARESSSWGPHSASVSAYHNRSAIVGKASGDELHPPYTTRSRSNTGFSRHNTGCLLCNNFTRHPTILASIKAKSLSAGRQVSREALAKSARPPPPAPARRSKQPSLFEIFGAVSAAAREAVRSNHGARLRARGRAVERCSTEEQEDGRDGENKQPPPVAERHLQAARASQVAGRREWRASATFPRRKIGSDVARSCRDESLKSSTRKALRPDLAPSTPVNRRRSCHAQFAPVWIKKNSARAAVLSSECSNHHLQRESAVSADRRESHHVLQVSSFSFQKAADEKRRWVKKSSSSHPQDISSGKHIFLHAQTPTPQVEKKESSAVKKGEKSSRQHERFFTRPKQPAKTDDGRTSLKGEDREVSVRIYSSGGAPQPIKSVLSLTIAQQSTSDPLLRRQERSRTVTAANSSGLAAAVAHWRAQEALQVNKRSMEKTAGKGPKAGRDPCHQGHYPSAFCFPESRLRTLWAVEGLSDALVVKRGLLTVLLLDGIGSAALLRRALSTPSEWEEQQQQQHKQHDAYRDNGEGLDCEEEIKALEDLPAKVRRKNVILALLQGTASLQQVLPVDVTQAQADLRLLSLQQLLVLRLRNCMEFESDSTYHSCHASFLHSLDYRLAELLGAWLVNRTCFDLFSSLVRQQQQELQRKKKNHGDSSFAAIASEGEERSSKQQREEDGQTNSTRVAAAICSGASTRSSSVQSTRHRGGSGEGGDGGEDGGGKDGGVVRRGREVDGGVGGGTGGVRVDALLPRRETGKEEGEAQAQKSAQTEDGSQGEARNGFGSAAGAASALHKEEVSGGRKMRAHVCWAEVVETHGVAAATGGAAGKPAGEPAAAGAPGAGEAPGVGKAPGVGEAVGAGAGGGNEDAASRQRAALPDVSEKSELTSECKKTLLTAFFKMTAAADSQQKQVAAEHLGKQLESGEKRGIQGQKKNEKEEEKKKEEEAARLTSLSEKKTNTVASIEAQARMLVDSAAERGLLSAYSPSSFDVPAGEAAAGGAQLRALGAALLRQLGLIVSVVGKGKSKSDNSSISPADLAVLTHLQKYVLEEKEEQHDTITSLTAPSTTRFLSRIASDVSKRTADLDSNTTMQKSSTDPERTGSLTREERAAICGGWLTKKVPVAAAAAASQPNGVWIRLLAAAGRSGTATSKRGSITSSTLSEHTAEKEVQKVEQETARREATAGSEAKKEREESAAAQVDSLAAAAKFIREGGEERGGGKPAADEKKKGTTATAEGTTLDATEAATAEGKRLKGAAKAAEEKSLDGAATADGKKEAVVEGKGCGDTCKIVVTSAADVGAMQATGGELRNTRQRAFTTSTAAAAATRSNLAAAIAASRLRRSLTAKAEVDSMDVQTSSGDEKPFQRGWMEAFLWLRLLSEREGGGKKDGGSCRGERARGKENSRTKEAAAKRESAPLEVVNFQQQLARESQKGTDKPRSGGRGVIELIVSNDRPIGCVMLWGMAPVEGRMFCRTSSGAAGGTSRAKAKWSVVAVPDTAVLRNYLGHDVQVNDVVSELKATLHRRSSTISTVRLAAADCEKEGTAAANTSAAGAYSPAAAAELSLPSAQVGKIRDDSSSAAAVDATVKSMLQCGRRRYTEDCQTGAAAAGGGGS